MLKMIIINYDVNEVQLTLKGPGRVGRGGGAAAVRSLCIQLPSLKLPCSSEPI